MPEKQVVALPYEDYAQSANTLFHFMSKSEYLKSILINRAIVPRYCLENIEYLNIHMNDKKFKEVAILQKCFCDIPFHKLTDSFELNGVGKEYNDLSEEEKIILSKNNTHPDFYGKFAVAFSKDWGEHNNLQPVHYLNKNSLHTMEFTKLFNSVLSTDSIPDEYANDIINRLSFVKPLRGIMKREVKCHKSHVVNIEFYKNFHDEMEWRYVPNTNVLTASKKNQIIVNPNILNKLDFINSINDSLATNEYKPLWLRYNYDDIRYIIVPDSHARIDIINSIISIPDERFNTKSDILMQKYILISKILVFEEIRKDW
ncbi:MAG: abortive infection system antitoxin AbiGi family protein [Clostridium sp.]|uniref:abortive infection system antitoxin AbiGi family protein n=1 Tax=Clostridium sp. TaxID=1506 RepID=UPI00290F5FAB|nr:abortive infection system antitoxin AbiGi family protein [Clostridium sp.]MDU7338718.1 abortive infection system antitoxin AbiGi family protein [Clostridium sp.]